MKFEQRIFYCAFCLHKHIQSKSQYFSVQGIKDHRKKNKQKKHFLTCMCDSEKVTGDETLLLSSMTSSDVMTLFMRRFVLLEKAI